MMAIKDQISYEDFSKLDIRVGLVTKAENIEESEKLIKLEVNFGELGIKQVLSGIREWYKPEDLVNRQFVFAVNLEPKKMMGMESQGMIMAADVPGDVVLLQLSKQVENGSIVR
jgi:methionyl-tRNA synthetase